MHITYYTHIGFTINYLAIALMRTAFKINKGSIRQRVSLSVLLAGTTIVRKVPPNGNHTIDCRPILIEILLMLAPLGSPFWKKSLRCDLA